MRRGLDGALADLTARSGRFKQACDHIFTHPGKRLRSGLAAAAAHFCDEQRHGHTIWSMMVMCELFHEASLIHDDHVDGSVERRGVPTIVSLFGANYAMAFAAFLVAEAIRHAAIVQRACGARIPLNHLVRLASGQIVELAKVPADATSAREHYRSVVDLKTTSLFLFSLKAGQALAPLGPDGQRALESYARGLGLAFQLFDDARDIEGTASSGRRAGIDLDAGLLTWPVVLWAERTGWCEAMARLKRREPGLLLELQAAHVAAETREEAHRVLDPARQALEHLPDTVGRAYLEHVLRLVVS
jgi:geranylgeranyl pyrophosphate synthase